MVAKWGVNNRREFGLDQDVPSKNFVVFVRDVAMAPFIIGRAFNYWSSSITRVIVPSSSCIGSLT